MKTLLKTLSVALLGCGIAVSAFAATATQSVGTEHSAKQAERQAKMQTQQAALFQQADSNKDGKLSSTEFARFHELKKAMWETRKQDMQNNRFARLDTNKDGGLSLDELKMAQAKHASSKHGHQGGQSAMTKPAL